MADLAHAQQLMEAYRFFPLDSGKQKGDRFLEPWILLLTMGRAGVSKNSLKRLTKQIDRFFAAPEISQALEAAGEEKDQFLNEHLLDSAKRYLEITKADPGYNSSLFGLLKMRQEDSESKLSGDVHKHMLGVLLEMDQFSYRTPLLRSLHRAFMETMSDADAWYEGWRESLDETRREKPDQLLAAGV